MSTSFTPALQTIQSLLGTRYQWGGNDKNGIDCSGFTRAVYEAMGIDLPRVSYQQAAAGQAIKRDQARVGDLVWWDLNGRNPGADHVGVYMGNGKVAEASSSRGQVVVRNLWGNAQFTRVGQVADGNQLPPLGSTAPGYGAVDEDQSFGRVLGTDTQPEPELDTTKIAAPEQRGIS